MKIWLVEVCSEYDGDRTEDTNVFSTMEKAQETIDKELKESNCVYVVLTRMGLDGETFRQEGQAEFFDGPSR